MIAGLPNAGAQTALLSPGGMIVREIEPSNLEMPFGSLDGFITPADLFFVRSHFSIPRIDVKTWRLKMEGEVERPLELTYDEVREMESRTIAVTIECAGNGRAFLTPPASGAQWERGAVGNAEWTGVPLTEILRRAGLKSTVREVVFGGNQHRLRRDVAQHVSVGRIRPQRLATLGIRLEGADEAWEGHAHGPSDRLERPLPTDGSR